MRSHHQEGEVNPALAEVENVAEVRKAYILLVQMLRDPLHSTELSELHLAEAQAFPFLPQSRSEAHWFSNPAKCILFTSVSMHAYDTAHMHTSANPLNPVRTAAEVRHEFEVRGLSIAAWARARGYSSQLVYQILAGRKPCLRGQSHRIAVQLGLKRGLIGSLQDVDVGATAGPQNSATTLRSGEDAAMS